ncbi:hypothetical protein MesoLjLc_65280 [Mesorhizobium sp. L-8-10]|uniref:DUF937 domain-containing protein n=1 Tax=Mesorhizobium sp. L-8-10 TaxID=2744523 RepID=UPI001928B5CB|nr:DUF937 domain-containing protein [Mesorhizobium sp. L-8-10]BCH34598.1 hypothetical protein MesoLjLc_65280 [Mesorhizobium sp. L-8-10]
MPNLFDMLANAQNGGGIEALARRFNLSQEQAQAAVEALLPAFSQGLKRNTSDPYGVGAFLSGLSSGQHAHYFDDAADAFSPQGTADGNDILGQIFGSKDLSRAVASQAAQATGIGQQVLQQMLPAVAAMIMGGLFKQSTNQMQAGGFGSASNPLQEIIEQMMKQGGGLGMPQAPQPRQAPQPADPLDNPFGKILQDMFGGGAKQAPQQRQQAPRQPQQMPGGYGDNPLGRIFEEMLRGGQATQPEPSPEPQPQRRANPGERPRNPYDDLFGDMFETGTKQRDDYQKGVESIFDQFVRGMDRYR